MTEINYGSFKQAAHFRAGRIRKIQVVVFHATAGLENANGMGAENVQSMFADPNSRVASAHVTVDQNSIARSVHDADTAFGAAHANACGAHAEQVGLTTQSAAEWKDPISQATIANAARYGRDMCGLYKLDKRILTVPELRDILTGASNATGITFHSDVEKAMPSTGHTDPGANYPRDLLLHLINSSPVPAPLPKPQNPYLAYSGACHRQPGQDQGGVVRFVKWALGKPVDGFFDDDLNLAVRRVQQIHGRPITGVVGPEGDWTLAYLRTLTR